MTPEQKQAWITALRSGKYKQTTGQLKDDIGYCCLGVYGEAVLGLTITPDGKGFLIDRELCGYEALGIEGRCRTTYINMNDRLGKTFDQIADFVEAYE